MRFYDVAKKEVGIESGMVVFDASEIAGALDDLPDFDEFTPEQYGRVAPPFVDEAFFVEATTVAQFVDTGDKLLDDRHNKYVAGRKVQRGCTVFATRVDTLDLNNIKRMYRNWDYKSAHWAVAMQSFVSIDDTQIAYSQSTVVIFVDKEGYILHDTKNLAIVRDDHHDGDPMRDVLAVNPVTFTLLCIAHLHKRTQVDHVVPNRSERRRAGKILTGKRGDYPLTDYYMLKIAPYTGGEIESLDDIKPLRVAKKGRREHKVRGHFRFYSEDRPLFGKVSGMVWVPDFDRGKGEKIEKGYKVT